MKELLEMTWKEIENIEKDKALVCVTVAPIEEHGPHLPIGTDIFEGEHWLSGLAERLEGRFMVYHLPPLAVAGASAPYPCSIHFSPLTVGKTVYEMLSGICKMGFQNILVIASHGDPIHHAAVEWACDKVNGEYGVRAISPMGAMFSLEHVNLDFKTVPEASELEKQYGDIHAGFVETSNMLDIAEGLVKDCYRNLPDTYICEKDMASAERILEAMGELGYLGAPRLARADLGKELNENAVSYLEQAAEAFLKRENYEAYSHHFLSGMPFMKRIFENA